MPSPLTEGDATLAQVLDPRGRILDATPLLRTTPLVGPQEIASAGAAPLVIDRDSVPGVEARTRLLVTRLGRKHSCPATPGQ